MSASLKLSGMSGSKREPRFALRFVSGIYKGGEYILPEGKVILVGRGSNLDLVLAEEKVSRKHAKLSTLGGGLTLVDLGSTNGTFVNGARVTQTELKEGDRVLIGTSIMRVIAAEKSSPALTATVAEIRAEIERSGRGATRGMTLMTGNLDEIPLPDIIQMFANLKKTGVLRISSNSQGRIYLRDGNVTYASIDDKPGMNPRKAAFRIIFWQTGRFELEPGNPGPLENELDLSSEGFVMEAMRQWDELERIRPALPKREDVLKLVSPLTAPLSGLEADELDVLQTVYNLGTLGSVIDACQAIDLEVCHHVYTLLERGYVEVALRGFRSASDPAALGSIPLFPLRTG